MSQRKALCIGIDEYARKPLGGCVNDARDWESLFSRDYEVSHLHNREATWSGIVNALRNLISESASGDVLVVTYSGHGMQIEDRKVLDEPDQLDEALVPIDYDSTADVLIDDDIADLIDKLPEGVNLTFLMDCCHSGTITREIRPFLRPKTRGVEYKERFLQVDKALAERIAKNIRRRRKSERSVDRGFQDVKSEILISACLPEETSKESGGSGLFTQAAIEFLRSASSSVTHQDFVNAVREPVARAIERIGASSQNPTLYCGPQDRNEILFSRKRGVDSSVGGSSSGGSSPSGSLADNLSNIFQRGTSQNTSNTLATFFESLAAVLRNRGC